MFPEIIPIWEIEDPKFLLTKEMRAAEKNMYASGTDPMILMHRAGEATANIVLKKIKNISNVIVFSGFGNNGGDGFIAASKFLAEGIPTDVFLVGTKEKPTSTEAKEALATLLKFSERKPTIFSKFGKKEKKIVDELIEENTVILDALLGTGIHGEVRSPIKEVLKSFSDYETIVSVDIPSGLDSDTGQWLGPKFNPRFTVTFHKPKMGMKSLVKKKKVVIADIGISKEAEHYIGIGHLVEFWPKRPAETHKGKNGRVMIIGGSIEYMGAPVLSAMGSLRAGADTVRIVVPDAISQVVAGVSPNFIVTRVPGQYHHPSNARSIARLALDRHDTVVVGMGISNQPEAWAFAREFVKEVKGKIKLVLDADGIRAFQGYLDILEDSNAILTPHKRELAWLMNDNKVPKTYMQKAEYIYKKAKKLGITILLKGRYDLISDGTRVLVNPAGHPGMSVGGSGDVLAGVVGYASSMIENRLYAASMAVHVTCKGGEIAGDKFGNSLVATDIPDGMAIYLKRAEVNN